MQAYQVLTSLLSFRVIGKLNESLSTCQLFSSETNFILKCFSWRLRSSLHKIAPKVKIIRLLRAFKKRYLRVDLRKSFVFARFQHFRGKFQKFVSKRKKNEFFFMSKTTRTNLYLTFTNSKGEVVYALSAGQVEQKNRRLRLRAFTFGLMCARIFQFIKRNKITRTFSVLLRNAKAFPGYRNHLRKQMRKNRVYLDNYYYRFVNIHGYPLTKKRVKRL